MLLSLFGVLFLILSIFQQVNCYVKDGKCYKPIKILIAIDSSGSIEPTTWQTEIDAAKETIQANAFEGSGNQFAIIQFSTKPHMHLDFDPNPAKATAVLDTLKENFKDGHSNIDYALEKAYKLFQTENSSSHLSVFLIISDGYMTFRNGKQNQFYLKTPRDKLVSAGVLVFALGVGKYVDFESLKFIASDPDISHVFQQDDARKLITEIQKAAERPCQGQGRADAALSCGKVKFERIGCFKDKGTDPRPLPELILTDRDPPSSKYSGQTINWKKWDTYLPDLVCRCANAVSGKGRSVFGLQFYGECWSNTKIDTYDDDGKAEKESNCKTIKYQPCTLSSDFCVGEEHHNFVYKITEVET